jgi:peroxiredoxin
MTGAARHLIGMPMASVPLTATDGTTVDLSLLRGMVVVYAYPRTGKPGIENPAGWDLIPGARGCTPQSRAFRDHFAELRVLGLTHLFGLSTQDTLYQREAADRLHLPFALLSDENLTLTRAMRLPTFETSRMTLLKRVKLMIKEGIIEHVFYPVFSSGCRCKRSDGVAGSKAPAELGESRSLEQPVPLRQLGSESDESAVSELFQNPICFGDWG